MIGKAVPNMVIGLAQATTILLIAQFWFHIPFVGSFVVLYAGLTLFLMAAVGLGLFVSSIAATMQQAMLFAFILILPFALLSGLTTPVNSMPAFLQSVMVINPLLYSLDLTKRVYLEGAGFAQLVSGFLPLAAIGFATLAGAAWLFRRRLTCDLEYRPGTVPEYSLAVQCAVAQYPRPVVVPREADWYEKHQQNEIKIWAAQRQFAGGHHRKDGQGRF
jgi:hypothetical protein